MTNEQNPFRIWEATIGDTFKAYCEAFAEPGLEIEDYEYLKSMIQTTMNFLIRKRERNED